MRRIEVCVIVGTMAAAALMAVAGCGGTGPLLGSPRGQSIRSLAIPDPWLNPVSDPGQTLRWLDIGDHQYADTFISGDSGFKYLDGTVHLSCTDGASLAFTVSAGSHALKPNFCYQMKLEGPAEQWGSDPNSDFVNGEFGYNGRWWCDSCNKSLTDNTVGSHQVRGHVVKGYLYFDFLVTDAQGAADHTAPVVNSYHVTWKTTQRTRDVKDGPIRDCTVVARSDGWAYDQNYTDENGEVVSLYGEWEPSRALPGELALAPGSYAGVQFRLTEESFHASGIGGNWATVMLANYISFTVTGGSDGPPSVAWVNPLNGATVDGSVALQIDAQDTEDPAGSLTVEWNVDGGDWDVASYNSSSGYYEATWDTTLLSDGSYTLNARAADSAGNEDTASILVTVGSGPAPVIVTGISPSAVGKGTQSDLTVTGSGFTAGAQVTFEGGTGAPPTASISWFSQVELRGTVTVKVNAKPNTVWDVRVTNPDGSSGVLMDAFTVIP